MDALPDEMVVHVMSFLKPIELLQTAARVCRRWEDLALNVALWTIAGGYCYHTANTLEPCAIRVVQGTCPGTDLDHPSESASGTAHSRTLALHGRADAGTLLLGEWRPCTTLHRLDLHACRLPPRLLRDLVDLFPALRALSLYDSGPKGSSLEYEALRDFTFLSALNISLCKEVPAGTVAAVAQRCVGLEELRCEWTEVVTDEDVAALTAAVGGQLRALALGGGALSDDAYQRLASCTRLRELSLAPCASLSDAALLRGVAPLPSLRALQLTDAGALTTSGLRALLAHSASAPALRSLSLAWCAAVDDAVLHLAAARCPSLERVSLRHLPAFGDSGVAALLRGCPKLTELSLVWNDAITGRHFLPLVDEFAPQLRHLDLGYCDGIAKELLDALVTRRRHLKVTRPEVWCRPRQTAHACCGPWALFPTSSSPSYSIFTG